MDLALTDVKLWGYDSVGDVGTPGDFQLVGLDHFDGPNQSAFTNGEAPYLDTPDAGDSYAYSMFPWNLAALFGPAPGATSQAVVKAQAEIPEFGFINTTVYLFETANASAGIDGALLSLFMFVEGDVGSWVTIDIPAEGAPIAAAVAAGRLGVAFQPEVRVSWVGVTVDAGVQPALRQRQRNDGLGMSGTPRWTGGSSRQKSTRWRGYL